MGTDFYAFEMLTGRRLTPLPVTAGTWNIKTNADESLTCSIPSRAAVTAKLKIWETTTLARNGLLAVVDGLPVAAGPLWKRSYKQGGNIELTAGGLRSYWERRLLLPLAARTKPLVDANGDPDASLDFAVSGVDAGTLAKRYVELVRLWPGGNIPMMLPADLAGTSSDTVKAIDLKTVRKLLDNLSARENGPDIAFVPRWAEDGLGIYWEMQTGTSAKPRLGNSDASLVQWTVGAQGGAAFDLSVAEDATGTAEEVFVVGGSGQDKVIAARSRNPKLAAEGYPLLQKADTGHSDIKEQAAAQSYADQGANLGQYSGSFLSMSVRANEPKTPRLGDYWLGDMATVVISEEEPVLPPGEDTVRIASIGGSVTKSHFDLVFAEDIA